MRISEAITRAEIHSITAYMKYLSHLQKHFVNYLVLNNTQKFSNMASKPIISDVLIIGGGPAGLSAATALSRQSITTTIFDSLSYRNYATDHMHNLPGFDHAPPAEFRAASRKELMGRYKTNSFVERKVTSLKKSDSSLFEAEDSEGQIYVGKKVIIATGVRDIFPADIEGYADCWGKCIFHCLFCHGYEESGSEKAALLATGFLANPQFALPISGMANRFAKEVVIYTNGNEETKVALQAALAESILSVTIDSRVLVKTEKLDVESNERVAVHFANGEKEILGFMVSIPEFEVNVPKGWMESLGLELDEMNNLKVDKMGQTTCSGVFAAGDGSTMMKSVPAAIFTGNMAGAMAVHQLVMGK
jgi:thioredoxin reductase